MAAEDAVIDAADLDAESAFWAGVLGGTVEADADWHTISDATGTPRMSDVPLLRHSTL